jgi:pyruvate dehydrogenase E2 component (dihydrolipoamide acetyltransferase)
MSAGHAASTAKGDVEVVEPTRAQQAAARRVAESRATVPDLTVGLRARVPGGAGELADRLVRAAALALSEMPEVNAAYRDARFERYGRVNVGVALDDGEAVVVPTIFDADQKDVAQVAAEREALAARAAAGELTAPDLAGPTFTVWHDERLDRLVPPLVTPQAANLGAGREQDGHVELTLVCDARILRPTQAASFLQRLAQHLG